MISDYASLQQAIADWLSRADLASQIPTFIQLAEARMNKDVRVLSMQAETSGYLNSPDIYLSTDILELQSVRMTLFGMDYEIPPLAPERMADRNVNTAMPLGYVRVGYVLYLIGGNIETQAPGSTSTPPTYSLLYFQKIPALSSVGTTTDLPGGGTETTAPNTNNWLLQSEPGLYLYASLIEASPYLQDDARTLVWAEQYKSILTGMRVADDNARYGNAPSTRMRGYTP